MSWISVKDARPKAVERKLSENVLVVMRNFDDDSVYRALAYYDYDCKDWKAINENNTGFYGVVTHWMPLPEPPTE
jgi:hypothetical protein